MTSIVMSSGHGKKIRGASGYLDEVDEARRVVNRIKELLPKITVYHDDISTSQNENLNRLTDFHNAQGKHDLDVSVHFNAYQTTSKAMGTECLYVTQEKLSKDVALAISKASGLLNRGPKKRTDLHFLNQCAAPAILIEVAFVDSSADEGMYEENFDEICQAIASTISGEEVTGVPPWEESKPPPDEEHPTIGKGDEGPAVGRVQTLLGVFPVDGDFGSITESAVKGFQAAAGLGADGIVGDKTWDALEDLNAAKVAGGNGLPPEQIRKICDLAKTSAIAKYSWQGGRGVMPSGYIQGVALSFGLAVQLLRHGEVVIQQMARKDTNNPDKDALSWYAKKFKDLGMDNSHSGVVTLRHLFALMMGLGPRESSGRYCEGRDMSATNVASDTAEAGMFQTSWNIRSGDDYIEPLLEDFWVNPNGFLTEFQAGVELDSNDLGNFGSGDGAKYQFLSKFAPAFHAFVTALGLRVLRQHWGPLNRNEVELRKEADDLLLQVEKLINSVKPEPPKPPDEKVPTITITIDPPGSVRVVVEGGAA
jgi:hypothetical protein